MAKAKRITAAREGIDRNKLYSLEEAVAMVKPNLTKPSRSQ
jgi:ribosomal protein L1